MKLNKIIRLVICVFIFHSCATLDEVTQSGVQNNAAQRNTKLHKKDVNFYLIGDAGHLEGQNSSRVFQSLTENFENATENDILLFLGDNVYPRGFGKTKSKQSEEILNNEIEIAKKFKGKTIFMPGNHDWYSGLDGLKKQEKYLEDALGKHTFLPQNGCPLDSYSVSKEVVIIFVDSEWYLTNWDLHPKINDNCEIDSREKFWTEFKSIINKNQNKSIVLAIHHPIESNGIHGGQFRFSATMAPLNVLRRASGVIPADLSFPLYREFSNRISTLLQDYKDNVVIVSGHDHNLQYLEYQGIPQIISGAGSKVKHVRHFENQKDVFGYAGLGFCVLNIAQDKHQVEFFDENNQSIKQQHIRTISKKQQIYTEEFPAEQTIAASIYPSAEPKSKFYNYFIGRHYRDFYTKKYLYKVVDLDTLYGGLKPVKLGGGNQSVSVRMKNKEGKEYVMRRMSKSASQFIQINMFPENYVQNNLKNTVSERFIKDFYTTAYPFAPLIVSKLSVKASVYYAKPEIYYVPKQKGLSEYNESLGNDLFLFEERMSEESKEKKYFGNSDDIISTDEVLENLIKDEKYEINTDLYIRSRLFDMWIGDWDRHADQFRWAVFEISKNKIVYEPIPRDRDQAFSNFDGAFTRTLATLIPALRKFQTFENDIKNVKTFNSNAILNDITFTNQTSFEQWEKQVNKLKQELTDEFITDVFNHLPHGIQDQKSDEIKDKLIQRKEHLLERAEEYYKFINKNVIIRGTDRDDFFEINRLDNGNTEIRITRIKKKETDHDKVFYKIFDPKITKEIWLYGFDDEDVFEVKGTQKSKIKIIIIGGQNRDSYLVENGHNVKIYDFKTNECLFEGALVAKKLSNEYDLNNYNYTKRKHNERKILPFLGFNPDEGFIIGGTAHFTKFGYERNPFTQKHSFGAKYFSATSGYELSYKAQFAKIFRRSNLIIDARYTTPAFTQNFFGLGNETINLEDDLDIEFYRTRLEQFNFKPTIINIGRLGSEFEIGMPFDYIQPNENENRFVEENLPLSDLQEKLFLGIESSYLYENNNNNSFSTLGISFGMKGGWKTNLEDSKANFGYFKTHFNLNYPIIKNDKLTFASMWYFDYRTNENFEFYQAASIGGKNGLRGFRNERFSGQYAYYQNTDLYLYLFDFNAGVLPAKFGVFSGYDYGRVWLKNEDSDKWHQAVGGGIYINTAGILNFQTSYFKSNEGGRFVFGLNVGF